MPPKNGCSGGGAVLEYTNQRTFSFYRLKNDIEEHYRFRFMGTSHSATLAIAEQTRICVSTRKLNLRAASRPLNLDISIYIQRF